jgi:hypothetical protein
MIELKSDGLVFSFPGVHPKATLYVEFQRTLRIPDDGGEYPLPPGFGAFPLRHVDDFYEGVPDRWLQHGGVMLPMYQSEAMWLKFNASYVDDQDYYPFAIKIATGKSNAVSGKPWDKELHRRPQDYVVAPIQQWLDGYCVEKGVIRQFVAMPFGAGYTAEEQLTGEAEHGGLQIMVFPMRREVFEEKFPKRVKEEEILGRPPSDRVCYLMERVDMGLAPGGRMRQELYEDRHDLGDWDSYQASRCFVHIANSLVWRSFTGEQPPTMPLTAAQYDRHGLPWFDYYDDGASAISGSRVWKALKSVAQLGTEKGEVPLPENESTSADKVIKLRKDLQPGQVREGDF